METQARRRKKITNNNYNRIKYELVIKISSAEGIDNPTTYPYRVAFWIRPNDEYITQEAYGSPNLVWNSTCHIELDILSMEDYRYLYLEVIRCGEAGSSGSEPGTSTGITLVGRAQIQLPKLWSKRGGRFELFRPDGDGVSAQGHVHVSMEITNSYRFF
ncbi:hypothetical protein JCGZ_04076 [Jatropha curcas]|uniref:C2 domain-containing protein n=1 Tax=Jatropha curcas TaxID=180498 RepID=A0A067KUW5_JATCU|nr:hypothetical protein JCGZ_04076 [Jatropha curcas]